MWGGFALNFCPHNYQEKVDKKKEYFSFIKITPFLLVYLFERKALTSTSLTLLKNTFIKRISKKYFIRFSNEVLFPVKK